MWAKHNTVYSLFLRITRPGDWLTLDLWQVAFMCQNAPSTCALQVVRARGAFTRTCKPFEYCAMYRIFLIHVAEIFKRKKNNILIHLSINFNKRILARMSRFKFAFTRERGFLWISKGSWLTFNILFFCKIMSIWPPIQFFKNPYLPTPTPHFCPSPSQSLIVLPHLVWHSSRFA